MKVALCCIGRLENQYAVEYVEWYKKLGFDKIFIYDNNHDGEEYFEDVLQSYIDNEFVEIIDYRNKDNAQLSAYNDCYSRYGFEYDWIAFFDFDEFLTLVKNVNIKEYLLNFNDYDCIKINWMVYTDNELIVNDKRPVMERFTVPMDYNKCFNYNFPENFHVKSIIRGRIDEFVWIGTPHVPILNIKYSNSIGGVGNSSPFQPYNFDIAYIKHFPMKTIDEYFNGKRIRGQAGVTYQHFKKFFNINDFFKINNKTEEKIKYIKSLIE